MLLRLVYTKTDYMKYLGHLEMVRFFERAFKRLKLPLKFSEGFNPRAKLTFGGPLSVGVSSLYEVMEVELTESIECDAFMTAFNLQAPLGIKIVAGRLTDKGQSLMSGLSLSVYRLELMKNENAKPAHLHDRYQASQALLLRKQNKKRKWVDKDLKPYIKGLELVEITPDKEVYTLSLEVTPTGTAKPTDIVDLLMQDQEDFDPDSLSVVRTGLFADGPEGYLPLLMLD